MTPTLDDDLVAYLRRQADRVIVHDTLDDIENATAHVSLISPPRRRHPVLILLAAAASIALLVGLATARTSGPHNGPAAAPTATTPVNTVPAAVATTAPVDLVPLPAGAMVQGVAPSCTTTDSIEYQCTITAYPVPVDIDMTGYAIAIVDDTSHVSGGCRATSPDGLAWACFVGQRAIDENLVGANYLGDWAPKGFIAG